MALPSGMRRSIAICLCWSFLIPMIPRPAEATDPYQFVIVTPGQPTIWSLGQAHYLLANMHQRNRDLSTRLPNENDLDPNRANASRLEALRRALRIEAQFDESIGAKNDLETERFRREEARQENARITLEERRQERTQVENELLVINEELTRLQELDRQSTEARARTTPPTPASAEDNERKLRIELLKVRKAQKDTEKARLDSEITALTTTATTNPTLPNFQTAPLTEGSGGLPESAAFDKFVEDALEGFSSPTLAASTALDNFVQMQYEIISKQLTLLRDETGPEERIIFLELPASIYSVDGWGDDYVAQVEWEVTKYFDKVPPRKFRNCVLSRTWAVGDAGNRQTDNTDIDDSICMQEDYDAVTDSDNCPVTLEMIKLAAYETTEKASLKSCVSQYLSDGDREESKGVMVLKDFTDPDPDTLPRRRKRQKEEEAEKFNFRTLPVRTLDVIPRQSSLNVNEHHATVKNTGILGFLKLLSGFGAKVDFQNQREMYEQFLQQEVFASGHGKGTNKFGWTFGPLPGSRRLAPGQRTTYAVLAIPRSTLAIELRPLTRVFKRTKTPGEGRYGDRVVVHVPGPQTDGFWIDRVSYVPVTKGRRVTAVLEGPYFSPQMGVLVNGVPLQKVVSITRAGSKEPPAASANGVHGEYEFTNSRQIVLSFNMGSDYTGTPLITLVTPDKSSSINFYKLTVNRRATRSSLHRLSPQEPMFIDDVNVNPELEVINTFPATGSRPAFTAARLRGKGLRRGGSVFINSTRLSDSIGVPFPTDLADIEPHYQGSTEFAVQESTGSYILFFKSPGDKCTVRYEHRTRQGIEEAKFEHTFRVPFAHKVRHYRRGVRGNPAEVHLTFTDKENIVAKVNLIEPLRPDTCHGLVQDGRDFRVTCMVPPVGGGVERDFITVEVVRKTAAGAFESKFVDIDLPVRPVVAAVVNPRTGNASGFADEQPVVTISGVHLKNVTAVFFGDQMVKLPASGSAESLAVKVPKADGIPPGQSVVVPVLFQTSTDGEARIPSGAFYTFFGPPLEPSYVTWPCVAGAPCPQPAGGKP